jgi:hypothetical protein
MSVLTYKVTNLLSTSLKIEDLGIILQARGGNDGSCVISSDSCDRSVSLRELRQKRWVSVHPLHASIPSNIKPQTTAQPQEPQEPQIDISALQNEIRSMNSRFDEVLAALKSVSQQAPIAAAAPVIIHVPVQMGSSGQSHFHENPSSDPMFIPSSIVPKDANVHINTNEESSSVDGFDDSLAALKAARKKKKDPL